MPLYAYKGERPTVADTAWIAPSAQVVGEVILSDDVGVWFGAVIRGDNTAIPIGARSNVQEGAMLHSDPGSPLSVGEECTIGHHAILHGCTIGDRVLIGMGATILNRAVIGEESIVGANALVTEGKVFPPRSLIVGSPAKAIRTLDDAVVAGLRLSAAHYVENAQAAADGLKEGLALMRQPVTPSQRATPGRIRATIARRESIVASAFFAPSAAVASLRT